LSFGIPPTEAASRFAEGQHPAPASCYSQSGQPEMAECGRGRLSSPVLPR